MGRLRTMISCRAQLDSVIQHARLHQTRFTLLQQFLSIECLLVSRTDAELLPGYNPVDLIMDFGRWSGFQTLVKSHICNTSRI